MNKQRKRKSRPLHKSIPTPLTSCYAAVNVSWHTKQKYYRIVEYINTSFKRVPKYWARKAIPLWKLVYTTAQLNKIHIDQLVSTELYIDLEDIG